MDNNKITVQESVTQKPKYRTGRFTASVICLALSLIFIAAFVIFYLTSRRELNASDSDAAISSVAFLALFTVIFAVLLFGASLTCSFFGFCLGKSSLTRLPSEKLFKWARLTTYANMATSVLSAIPLILMLILFTA